MTQQQISTPSIIDIEDLKILSSAGYSSLGITYRDPWDEVLTALEARSLDPATVVAGMDGALSPNSGNPFITQSYQALRLESRGLVLIGPIGSNADFEGTTEGVFNTAIASLPAEGGVIAVMAGTYTFNSTISLPKSVCIIGVHPLSVTIQGTGDFPVFDLVGEDSRLEFLTLENSSAVSYPVVNLTGIKTMLIGCCVSVYSLLGARLVGSKACVKSCLFESDSSGIWLQGVYQYVESCSFSGSLGDGVLRFENSMCSALSNFIRDSVTGASYIIPSPVCANNKIVANHLGTSTAVSAAIDHGTGTVRYANTPDTPAANENNFLLALQNYTGQPLLDSTEMVLSNHAAHDYLTSKDAASILSSFDLFTQRIYEERSWILTSNDPTFDSVGVPLTGIFSWVGNVLTWPNFSVHSLVPNNTWTIAASSTAIAVDQALVLDIDRTTSGSIVPVVKSLPRVLSNPSDMNQFVLAFSPASGVLVWTKGYRLLTELTSFDIDGIPLPVNRYIGIPTDPRNTPVIPSSFAIGDDLTEKLGSQSNLLHSLYEKSNLWEYSSDSIDTFPKPGAWLALTDNRPETPSHLIQIKGTTYGLFPNYGVYRWYRETVGGNPGAWGVLGSNPAGTGPFASMSLVGTSSLALLTCSGTIVIWDTDSLAWSTVSPTTSLTLPFPNARSGSYDPCGQADFAIQTPYYSLFELLDGRSILYFQTLNTLVETSRIFTETPKGAALLGRHLKDSGFNVARNNWIDTVDNGAYSTLQGLPVFGMASPAVEIPPQLYSASISTIKWDTLKHESFSYDPFSNAFISVVTNASGIFYVLGGGADSAKLLSIVTIGTTTGFTDFVPHGWLANIGYGGEIIAFGTTIATSAFTVIIGKVNISGSLGSSPFTWTRTVLGGANSCKGSIGVIDRWNNQGSGDIHILASDLARSSRPTWWKYARSAATWTSATLADSGGSAIVAQAVSNSFTYDASIDRQAGYGVASSSAIRFLVKDSARGGRPTMFAFNPSTSLYSGIRLSEGGAPYDIVVAGADVNSITQVYGGLYQNAWDANIWVSRENSGNQIKVITYFATANTWNIMSVGSGGTHLNSLSLGTPYTKRTGSLVGTPTLTTFVDSSSSRDIYVWTQSVGLLKGTITAYYLTGVPTATWTQYDKRMPSAIPVFSSNPMSTYSPNLAPSRCDISLQIASLAEKTLPIYGTGLSATTGGIQWFEPGTKVKQITSTIWAGLNRNGYLWIGNPTYSSAQQELYPTGSLTVRGDIAVLNLGYTDDFDWAFNGSLSQIAFVYKDINNANRLGFILYDLATNSVTHERGGASGVIPLGGAPQISYNSVSNSWSIVAQDATAPASNARLLLFRRSAGASVWSPDESALASGSGKNPSKPYHLADGSLLLATESGISYNLLISKRDYTTSSWSSVYLSTGGGFKSPKLIVTSNGLMWWAFGGVDSSARIAWSSNALTGWAIWSGSPTLSALAYTRITTPTLLALTSSVIVASAAALDGAIPANRELLIWRFDNAGTVKLVGAFTSKGRLQSAAYSGEEEDGITDLSWTPDQKLIYGATRPTRSTLHWSLRGSTQSWNVPHGDSLLGSGRFITLGNKHFREQWGSASGTGSGIDGQDLIIEYPSLTSWSVLPLALRTGETDFTSVRWPFTTSSGYLFTTGSPSAGISDDTGAALGTLVTSASRGWPLILGNTRWSGLSHTGPGVFTQGSMLGLFPPTGSTNLAYFGNATIGSSNLFKIKAQAAITFNGTRTWSVGPSKQYTLVGPITYLVDTSLAALGAHLVLEFNTSSSLVKDATENPLSYWLAIDHSSTKYAVVIAEAREQEMLLYPSLGSRTSVQLLTYGHLEPIEMMSDISNWQYSIPYRLDIVPAYEIATISGNSLALKEIGSLRGTQPSTLSISKQQISMRRLLPNEGCFLFQTISSSVNSSSSRTSALATLTSSLVTIDKLNGEMP